MENTKVRELRAMKLRTWSYRLGAAKFKAGKLFESCITETECEGWLDAAAREYVTSLTTSMSQV